MVEALEANAKPVTASASQCAPSQSTRVGSDKALWYHGDGSVCVCDAAFPDKSSRQQQKAVAVGRRSRPSQKAVAVGGRSR